MTSTSMFPVPDPILEEVRAIRRQISDALPTDPKACEEHFRRVMEKFPGHPIYERLPQRKTDPQSPAA